MIPYYEKIDCLVVGCSLWDRNLQPVCHGAKRDICGMLSHSRAKVSSAREADVFCSVVYSSTIDDLYISNKRMWKNKSALLRLSKRLEFCFLVASLDFFSFYLIKSNQCTLRHLCSTSGVCRRQGIQLVRLEMSPK